MHTLSTIGAAALAFAASAFAQAEVNFSLDGSHRIRYETLNNTFRSAEPQSDQIVVSRLLVSTKFQYDQFVSEFELQDSRAWLDDDDTPLGTDDVNTLEPLQVWAGWQYKGENGNALVKAGRMTANIGSRRLVSRNGFRNTINSFAGVQGIFENDNWKLQSLYFLPVQRLPGNREALDNNERAFDNSHSDTHLSGVHLTHKATNNSLAEVYFFDLKETDQPEQATRNRSLSTLGFRLLQKPSVNQWDYEIEAAYQFGRARASSSALDTNDLTVKAGFAHVQLGYQFDDKWASRIVVQADYASGDDDPNDGDFNRFDTLFGSRGFDFGRTGIYGAFARSNILSPGAKWVFKANKRYSGFIGYRAIWLASSRDALTTTGLRDATGDSGNFVGQQFDTDIRIKINSFTTIDVGGVYLSKGSFLNDAQNVVDSEDATYFYTQATFKF